MNEELSAWREAFPDHTYHDGTIIPKLETIPYGCHVDCVIDEDEPEPVCVFDTGDIDDCIHALNLRRNGKGKMGCEHWHKVGARVPSKDS